MAAYSMDLRERVLADSDAGMPTKQVAEKYGVNRPAFEAFVEQVLVPTLRPGDIVVMDNLSSHKSARTTELIHAARAELVYLPPYSPDFNPIEPAFSKIKQALRSLPLRTVEAIWSTMQSVLERVTSSDAQGFFRHCGYAPESN